MEFNPTRAIVHNEGCDLHYWYQGKGPLLVFVPGGNGHGKQFNKMIAALSGKFTCATFDRRQMSASQVKVNKKLSPPQQGRDIRAVIQVLGFDKANIFGSSSGGLFAFQLANDYPEMVQHLIAHEAATPFLLPDAAELYDRFLNLLEVYNTQGFDKASAILETYFTGYADEGIPKTVPPEPENPQNWWQNELPFQLSYTPNFHRLKENKISIGVMRGARCKDAFFSRSATEQAKILDCPCAVVPGHHGGFEVETDEFIPHLLDMLDTLEQRKNST